jgi:hypothetical protein
MCGAVALRNLLVGKLVMPMLANASLVATMFRKISLFRIFRRGSVPFAKFALAFGPTPRTPDVGVGG